MDRSKSSTDISSPVCRSFTVDAAAPGDDAAAPGAFSIRSAAASSTRNSWPVSRSLMRNTFSISNDFGVADAPSVVGETDVWG